MMAFDICSELFKQDTAGTVARKAALNEVQIHRLTGAGGGKEELGPIFNGLEDNHRVKTASFCR